MALLNIDPLLSLSGGVSGVSTKLRERPQGRRLFDLLRTGDTLVVRWVDRLGRNYEDICETIREFMRRGVVRSSACTAGTRFPSRRARRSFNTRS
jgi:DNA invertase Pin-like site-specific DNA recombinase